jgi:hypothetical protein
MRSEEQQKREALSDIRRGSEAEAMLNNPLYIETFAAIEAAMFVEFRDSKLGDEELRHELWQRMQLAKQFQGRFESIVKHGNKGKQTLTLLDKAKRMTGF